MVDPQDALSVEVLVPIPSLNIPFRASRFFSNESSGLETTVKVTLKWKNPGPKTVASLWCSTLWVMFSSTGPAAPDQLSPLARESLPSAEPSGTFRLP